MAWNQPSIKLEKIVSTPMQLITVNIPEENDLNFGVYLQDCDRVLSGLLDNSRVRNPNSYTFLTTAPSIDSLKQLRDRWEIYFLKHYSLHASHKVFITKTIQLSLCTLLWVNICKLNELIINLGGFQFLAASDYAYTRLYEICTSSQSIGSYSLSQWLTARDCLNKRMRDLDYSEQFIDYFRQLTMRLSVLVAKGHDSSVLDDSELRCCVSQPGSKGPALYSFKPFAIEELCAWYYHVRSLIRHYMWFERRGPDSYEVSDSMVAAAREMLGEQAGTIKMSSKFLQKFKQKLILPLSLQQGEKERYIRQKGTASSDAEILNHYRAPGFMEHLSQKYFRERSLQQMITRPDLTSPGMHKCRRYGWIETLVTMKIINLLFLRHRSRFPWYNMCVLLEQDFDEHIQKEALRKHPCIVQNFNGFDVVHKGIYINTRCIIRALLVWSRIVLTETDGKLFERYNVKNLLADFLQCEQLETDSEQPIQVDEDYYDECFSEGVSLSEEFISLVNVVQRKRKAIS